VRVLVTGGTGLIGQGLGKELSAVGHAVTLLTRRASVAGYPSIQWDPDNGKLEGKQLEGFDAIIHLAGEGIGDQRWSVARKGQIVRSRVASSRLLAKAIGEMHTPPKVLISTSAIGYYGDRGDELLTEESGPGKGFLSDLCVEWEKAVEPVKGRGVRLVIFRIGVVLSTEGGALAEMLRHYQFGLGGKLGSGKQYWSWVGYQDLIRAIFFALDTNKLAGSVNLVAPNPVTNAQFNAALGEALQRPAFMAAPGFVLRLILGEMADTLLLASTRVDAKRLREAKFQFQQPELESTLRSLLSA
jgi:uncharacterized protein (TIGR01777 family)